MNRSKGKMGDEEPIVIKKRQALRRSKIIISKCRKSANSSKTLVDDKKINGEVITEKEGKDVDAKSIEVEIIKQKAPASKKAVTTKTNRKRKVSDSVTDSDIIVLDDDDDDDDSPVIIEHRKGNASDRKDETPSVEFKGFKKRILAQTEKLKQVSATNSEQGKSDPALDPHLVKEKRDVRQKVIKATKLRKKAINVGKKGNEGDSDENQGESQTEYAQYLGLQPTMQFKCYRCGERGFPSMLALNMHQRGCGVAHKNNLFTNLQQDTLAAPSDPNMLTNFRITRKVYLCSACGTYYENWNLFLHMRDVHKKHICLFCLTMFGLADKLADHLKISHNVQEQHFNSSDDFQDVYKGSCFLICCTCENMFNERENFYHHHCEKRDPTAKCNFCGVKCGHYFTCPKSTTQLPANVLNVNQTSIAAKSQTSGLTKYAGAKNKSCEDHWMGQGKKSQGASQLDSDDLYDISDAASFCHVALADESGENEKTVSENSLMEVAEVDDKFSKIETPPNEECKGPPEINSSSDSNRIDDQIESIVNEHNELDIVDKIVPSEKSSEKTKLDQQEVLPEESSVTDSSVAENEVISEKEKPEKDNNIVTGDSLKEINQQNDNANQNIEESESDSSKEPLIENSDLSRSEDEDSTSNLQKSEDTIINIQQSKDTSNIQQSEGTTTDKEKSEDTSNIEESEDTSNIEKSEETCNTEKSEDAISNLQKIENITYNMQKPVEEVQLGDKLNPIEKNSRNENESSSSDSDGEPATQLSLSQDDSESSSEESSEEECKNKEKQSITSKKETSLCESDDSDTSGLVVDEKTKIMNDGSDDIEETSNCNIPEEDKDSLLDTKSTESNDTTKDFHLDAVPLTEKEVENENKESEPTGVPEEIPNTPSPEVGDDIPLASQDVPAMALTLEDKLEVASSQSVVKECVRTSCQNCVYCSHAIKIAVNGKQLALHLLAEHRYKPVKNNETSQDVVNKLKTSLNALEPLFFNTDSYDSSDKSQNISYDYTYECFQCRFVTSVHKELYVHKRKMHQKTVLLCVMCKSNFYSYSELLCHMCPGIYVSEDIKFRCCFCNLDMIPSAFRLMVHLRKSHHTCDICLEVAGDQQKLSSHMWKHKLNHLCYRCGIAYRNKPDITKHLFWKHGTESVLCKKCLQKKWPHVYHFCIPPTQFLCEECDKKFTKAVALKVHKRFHSGELPYGCTKCDQRFVSKKLLLKHEDSHKQPTPVEKYICKSDSENNQIESTDEHINVDLIDEPNFENIEKDKSSLEVSKTNEDPSIGVPESKSKKKKKKDKDTKPVLDVYDLPPLNLSSESDSSDEESANTTNIKEKQVSDTLPQSAINEENLESNTSENVEPSEENQIPVPIVDGVWDNFHSYKAELEKRESKDLSLPNILPSSSSANINLQPETLVNIESPNVLLLDHSYCLIPGKPKSTENEEVGDKPKISEPTLVEETSVEELKEIPAPRGHSSSIDHAYATINSSNADGVTVSTLPPDQKPSTPPIPDVPPAEIHSSSKKKQKTPKKKKHSANSSSSSDSSSDSDSTDLTCGGNCSCSNSSSSNSSSSSSSDSDSSTSEGRRRVAARREKKKERLKHKHHKEEPPPAPVITRLSPPKENPVVDIPVEPLEVPIKESDLDTDESSTDEDFYDKYPQSHARQQLEKRNKLMLLASVAPVNNGTVSPPPPLPQPPPPAPPPPPPVEEELSPPTPTVKRKIKTKRRRKSQQSKKSAIKATIPVQTQPSTSSNIPNATSTPDMLSNHTLVGKTASSFLKTTISTLHSDATGSGSENESARLSKRKRVRNKFYGYSSEEEGEKRSLKWKRLEPAPVPQSLGIQPTLTIQRPQLSIMGQVKKPELSESSGTDDEPIVKKDNYSNSSSTSSESDNDLDSKEQIQKDQTEKSDNLYCYCQCPYDEVSEMIACDGQDCTIEWFHFECVGIMVPPKGKWYCPDCRKRRDLM